MELLKEYIKQKDICDYNKLNTSYMYVWLIGTDGKAYQYKVNRLKGFLMYIQFKEDDKEQIHKDLLNYYDEEDIKHIENKITEDTGTNKHNMCVMYVILYEKGLISKWNY